MHRRTKTRLLYIEGRDAARRGSRSGTSPVTLHSRYRKRAQDGRLQPCQGIPTSCLRGNSLQSLWMATLAMAL